MKPRLVVLMLCLLWGATALAQAPAVNLALHRPYVTTSPQLPGWTGLVDGDRESDSAPGCFALATGGELPKAVTIDLGAECRVSKVVVYNSANGNTRTVSLASSTDGANYKKLRDPDFTFADQDAIVLSVTFQPRAVRFVRVTFRDTWKGGLGGDLCFFLREVEVYGQPGKAAEEDPLKAAAAQSPLQSARVVSLFRRYCLQEDGPLDIAVLGDLTVVDAAKEGHWATVAATALRRLYPDKPLTVEMVGGTSGSISTALEWADRQTMTLAPDLILVSYGAQAAAARADVDEFRVKYQSLLNQLQENTAALVVAIAPPPYLPPDPLTAADRSRERNTRPYAWAVEQVALSLGLPLVRTTSVMARLPETKERSALYLDNQHLGQPGHQALGLAIADLLR